MGFSLSGSNSGGTSRSSLRLHQLFFNKNILLLVFYEPAQCYQFRLVNSLGEVLAHPSIFYTAEAAERAGRNLWARLSQAG